jgi:hypothetical protein
MAIEMTKGMEMAVLAAGSLALALRNGGAVFLAAVTLSFSTGQRTRIVFQMFIERTVFQKVICCEFDMSPFTMLFG